jgi:uncharacterized protein
MFQSEEQRLIQVLDDTHQWPGIYSFKFIVPSAKAKELENLILEASHIETRPSSSGKFLAYTFHCAVGSGREVLEIYSRAKSIDGILSL